MNKEELNSEQLWNYVSGTLTSEERARIDALLATNKQAREEVEFLRLLETDLSDLQEEAPSMGFANSVVNTLEREQAWKAKTKTSTRFFPMFVIGGIVLASAAAIAGAIMSNANIPVLEESINTSLLAVLLSSLLLWGFYLMDRVFKRAFRHSEEADETTFKT